MLLCSYALLMCFDFAISELISLPENLVRIAAVMIYGFGNCFEILYVLNQKRYLYFHTNMLKFQMRPFLLLPKKC